MALLQLLHQVQIPAGILLHTLQKSLLCSRHCLDLRGHHIAEVIQTHIALALYAEGRNAVAGDLCQQRAADPLDAKGKAGVLDGAGMAQVAEHFQKTRGLFLIQAIQQVWDMGIRVAELGRSGHHLLRLGGMGDQSDGHHGFIPPL